MADPIRHRSSRDRRSKSKVTDDSMFEQAPPPVPMPPPPMDIPIRRKTMPGTDWTATARAFQQRRQEDDIAMVEPGDPSENPGAPGLKRTDSSADKRKSGLGGMFGGVFGKKDKEKDRPDLKRRSTAPAEDKSRAYRQDDRKTRRYSRDVGPEIDVTMTGGASEEDQEARRAARRARRAEREAGQRGPGDARAAKEESRRERQRKEEEDEREARRAAKREKRRAAEAAERRVEEEREAKEAERAERRRARKEKEAAQTDGEPRGDDPSRSKRRHSHKDGDDDEARRRRREDRVKSSDPRKSGRKSAPEPEFLPADGPVYSRSKPNKTSAWPHSGTDSWVRDAADAPPPPNFATGEASPVDDTVGGEAERKRMRRTRPGGNDDDRRRRRDERRREKETGKPTRSSEGSQEDAIRESQRDSGFETSRAPSASAGLFSRWKRYGGF